MTAQYTYEVEERRHFADGVRWVLLAPSVSIDHVSDAVGYAVVSARQHNTSTRVVRREYTRHRRGTATVRREVIVTFDHHGKRVRRRNEEA